MLRGRPLEHGTGEIGMWVRVDEAGRGLGTRLLRAMVDWADADWPFQKLTWLCDSRNLASARVAEKCGFQLEGRLREHGPAVSGPVARPRSCSACSAATRVPGGPAGERPGRAGRGPPGAGR
jgi:RimJ/RimL family protein N-acetyltransferase